MKKTLTVKWTVKFNSLKPLALLAAGGLATQLASGQPIAPPPGMVAWWPGDGNANDIYGTNHGTLLGGATATAGGKVGQAFDLNGSSGYIEVPDSPDLDFPNGMTIEMWVMPYLQLSEQRPWTRLMDKNDGDQGEHGFGLGTTGSQNTHPENGQGNLYWGCSDGAPALPQSLYTSEADLLWPYQFSHLATTYDPQQGEMAMYINGQPVGRTNVGNFHIAKASVPLRIGADTWNGAPGTAFFKGRIDEVALYKRALGSNEIAAIYTAGTAGKRKDPLITQHPSPQTQIGYWGKSATFTVTAKGTQPLRYQWLKNGVPLAGATDSTLTLSNLQATNSGSYSVTVSNSVGAVTTYPGLLSVSPVEMNFALYGGIQMNGVVGQTYGVQSTLDLSNTNSWVGRTNITLPTPTYLWYDSHPATHPQTYYRVVPGPISVP
jgi:hypothetical protein